MDYFTIKKLVRYNPETGKLFWKKRDASMFNVEKETSRNRAVNTWNARYAGSEITSKSPHGHIIVHFNLGRRWRTGAHRVAWLIYYGEWPSGVIDHINGDPADNRIVNLRDCTISQNNRNQRLSDRNTSGKIGVTFYKRTNKWRAWIKVNGKVISLGYHDDKQSAISARVAAEKVHGFFEAEKYEAAQ